MSSVPALQQISISLSLERNAVAPASAVSPERCAREFKMLRENMLEKCEGPWPYNLQERMPPFHICMSNGFADHVRRLHRLLDKALVDIVERWHSDVEADFPNRMPLEPHERELLRWIDGPGSKHVSPFRERYGTYRTDFLIDRAEDGAEQARICEINSRITFNCFWMAGMQAEAIPLLKKSPDDEFFPPDDFQATKRAIFECFDPTKTLYNIRETWPGADSHFLLRDWERETGKPGKTIKPSQLRVRHDPQGLDGYTLYFLPDSDLSNGDAAENMYDEIHQCGIEWFQEEYAAIDTEVLHAVASRCINDLRNIFLVHDKRILGVVRDELPNLVAKGVLTEEESSILREGVINTLLPGTTAMKDLLESSRRNEDLRKRYIIKPVRDARCRGIRLGRNVSQTEWLELLEIMSAKALRPSENAVVIQDLVDHIWYDLVTHDEGRLDPEEYHLIGTFHMINSKSDVFGP